MKRKQTKLAEKKPAPQLESTALAVRNAILPPELVATKREALKVAEAIQAVGGRCLNDQVLVLRQSPQQNYGRIIIPDSAQEKSEAGVVVAVGTGYLLESGIKVPLDLKVGDAVKFSKYYGTEVKIGGITFLQLKECECEFAI